MWTKNVGKVLDLIPTQAISCGFYHHGVDYYDIFLAEECNYFIYLLMYYLLWSL